MAWTSSPFKRSDGKEKGRLRGGGWILPKDRQHKKNEITLASLKFKSSVITIPAKTFRREYGSCPLMTSINFSNTNRPIVSAWICGNSIDDDLSSTGIGTFFSGCIIGLQPYLLEGFVYKGGDMEYRDNAL
uniref:Uncharacterized protein n=1 Tax=Megaselia scalaris TaxID=36166 RepID=T1GVA7_MEGSC